MCCGYATVLKNKDYFLLKHLHRSLKRSIFLITMFFSHIAHTVFAVSLLASAVFLRKLLALRAPARTLR